MSYREKKTDRALQIDLLKIQQKYAFFVAFFSVVMSVGVSIFIFSLTLWLSSRLTKNAIPMEWNIIITAYFYMGGILVIISAIAFFIIYNRQNKEIETLEKEYLKEW